MSETTSTAPIATIASLSAHEGQTVTLRGWLYNLRASGKLLFPIFRDGTGTIQGIVPKAAVPEDVFITLKELSLESSLTVTGKVRADSRAPSGYELDVEDVTIIQKVPEDTPFPIQLKEAGVDFLMEHRHLWLRTPRQSAILRVRATIMRAASEFFDTNGFIRTDPPILTPNACEGTSELFEMDYFDDDKAYLTQSGQLYIEATALALGKVYSFGPTFRAEKSKTRRHLTEFWMIEPEVAFLELDGLMDLAEAFITHIVTRVLEFHRADLKVIGKDVTKLEAIIAPTSPTTSTVAAENQSVILAPAPAATSTVATENQSVILSEAQSAQSKDPEAVSPTNTPQTLSATKDSNSATESDAVILSEAQSAQSKDPEAVSPTNTPQTLSATKDSNSATESDAVILSEAQSAQSKDPEAVSPTNTPQTLSATKDSNSATESDAVILSEAQSAQSKNPEDANPANTSQPLSATKSNRFPRLSYDAAHAMLEQAYAEGKLENPHKYGDDFGSPDETYISSQFSKPVMIHRYPAAFKAFYMQPDPHDPSKALCVDVLAPEGYGEIIGGSQRIDSYDLLKSRIEEHDLPLAAFQWYLDLRKYGSVPHSGFGMGIERAVAWICGLDHVRETIPFARTLNRIYP